MKQYIVAYLVIVAFAIIVTFTLVQYLLPYLESSKPPGTKTLPHEPESDRRFFLTFDLNSLGDNPEADDGISDAIRRIAGLFGFLVVWFITRHSVLKVSTSQWQWSFVWIALAVLISYFSFCLLFDSLVLLPYASWPDSK